ncbi:hypothetical protein PR370_06095 [Mycobacterium marinum]|uniref:hypothetical protein n=1 Tax=Mycobacterium marinum TaxID=1781 RepID=UPI00235A26D8|nr:hypothetical protein [Mycobacterium marinum]MDC8982162.1 hypothetical protein [Mycobacterium marinum]MDC8998884.1 hypothetical protein [Mycobacterium marinum]MDC9009609.1 hypothetical protein [Mycobacterium marinum]
MHDLLHLRWRTAQLLLAAAEGQDDQVAALRWAMRVERLDSDDVRDELRLLSRQFGHRATFYLRDEVSRVWGQLIRLCVRCGRPSRHLDREWICASCVVEERRL